MGFMAGTTSYSKPEDAHRRLFAALDKVATRPGTGSADRGTSIDDTLDHVRGLFDDLLASLETLPDVLELSQLTTLVEQLGTRRLTVAGRVVGSSGDLRSDRRRAREALASASMSSATCARDARRVTAMAINPDLAEAVDQGTITVDAIDQLNKAADNTTGRIPGELLHNTAGLTPDQTAQVVERFLEQRVDAKEVEDRHRQQMQARTVTRYRARGLAGIAIEGPDAIVAAMWEHINRQADTRYQAGGGRGTPHTQQAPLEHRRFDAVQSLLAGDPSGGGTGGRAAVVITIDGTQLFDQPDQPVVSTQLGTGPIPADVLWQYLKSSPVHVLVRGVDGSPLWLGRTRRRATDQQFLALAVRDRGCVLCRTSIARCDAHHLMPWHAPGQGHTDIDQMALLCGLCHGDLHQSNRTLYRQRGPDDRAVWSTRPATPEETPVRAVGRPKLE